MGVHAKRWLYLSRAGAHSPLPSSQLPRRGPAVCPYGAGTHPVNTGFAQLEHLDWSGSRDGSVALRRKDGGR
ncbi:hypothetical protein FM103_02520 [Corynebacterium xerosis]|nr:hypothetical protein FM103_02520 [Corynebacterium xerosis]